jgi:signal transduction histidine kinase
MRRLYQSGLIVLPIVSGYAKLISRQTTHEMKNGYRNEEELQLAKTHTDQGATALNNPHPLTDAQRSHNQLIAVLNSVGEGVLMVQLDGRINLANAPIEALTATPLKDFIGQPLSELPAETLKALGLTANEVDQWLKHLPRGRPPTPQKKTFELKTPSASHMLERTMVPVWDEEGNVIGGLLTLRDISQEQRLNITRELLAETVVHDLRSPISTILSALDLLQDIIDTESDEIAAHAIRVAQRTAKRMIHLIESLLEISRMQSGEIGLEFSSVNISWLIDSLVSDYLPQAQELDIRLTSSVASGIPPVQADESKINRVLANLVDNAVKFTPAGGNIHIAAEVTGDQVKIQVSDSGPGIPVEYREKIFERFAQIPGRRGRKRGSGLGLAFCKIAVNAHGGQIWVEPRPGGGSVFSFTLPLKATR